MQPVYVKSSGSTSFPLLKKVLVAFGDQVGFANTLDEALDQVFGGNSGASAGDAENVDGSGNDSSSANTGSSSGTMSNGLKSALNDASQAMKDSDAAMKKGDWSAYGEAQKKLQEALNKALELEQ